MTVLRYDLVHLLLHRLRLYVALLLLLLWVAGDLLRLLVKYLLRVNVDLLLLVHLLVEVYLLLAMIYLMLANVYLLLLSHN